MKTSNFTDLTVRIDYSPEDLRRIYQRISPPGSKSLTTVEEYLSGILNQHLLALDLRPNTGYELDASEIIKPLTLNYEHIGRIKEYFKYNC